MIPRLPIGLLCAALLSFACGPRARSQSHRAGARAGDRTLAGTTLAPRLEVSVDGDARFTLRVTNVGTAAADVSFPDGRTHEFEVLDSAGRPVWRWSDGRLFTQAVQERVLRGGEALTFDARWTPPAPGRYRIVATVRSAAAPAHETATFVVPGE